MIVGFDSYKQRWSMLSSDVIRPGLEAIKEALKMLNNPHEKLSCVHIAGTNGKGSTLTFIEKIAMEHGLTVGKFMSPCIVDVHDQIQINGKPITQNELNDVFSIMRDANISGQLTDFELLTCAAFIHFNNKKVDLVLLEAGMGGREDSTNVIIPIVSVIPSIALEHTRFLGNSIQSIAYHKAGIIKENRPIVIGKLPDEAFDVVKSEAIKKHSSLYCLGKHFEVCFTNEGDIYKNRVKETQIDHLKRSLPGDHQGANMALAITAFLEVADFFQLDINIEKIREGIFQTKVPGRFEQILDHVYFDGAHNPDSAEKLVHTIKQHFPNESIRFCVGMLADKDVESVLRILEQVSNEFYFIDFTNNRAMKAHEIMNLSNASKKQIIKDPVTFLQHSNSLKGKTFVTGSLYLLTEIRGYFS